MLASPPWSSLRRLGICGVRPPPRLTSRVCGNCTHCQVADPWGRGAAAGPGACHPPHRHRSDSGYKRGPGGDHTHCPFHRWAGRGQRWSPSPEPLCGDGQEANSTPQVGGASTSPFPPQLEQHLASDTLSLLGRDLPPQSMSPPCNPQRAQEASVHSHVRSPSPRAPPHQPGGVILCEPHPACGDTRGHSVTTCAELTHCPLLLPPSPPRYQLCGVTTTYSHLLGFLLIFCPPPIKHQAPEGEGPVCPQHRGRHLALDVKDHKRNDRPWDPTVT